MKTNKQNKRNKPKQMDWDLLDSDECINPKYQTLLIILILSIWLTNCIF